MMYLDSSVLVKLFSPEPETKFYAEKVNGKPMTSSMLAWTELASALCAKERSRLIKPESHKASWHGFLQQVESKGLLLHPLNDSVCRRAQEILQKCSPSLALRALDAIHLATCSQHLDFPLLTHDDRMKSAAQHLGIPILE